MTKSPAGALGYFDIRVDDVAPDRMRANWRGGRSASTTTRS
jgi:hypothetical protein